MGRRVGLGDFAGADVTGDGAGAGLERYAVLLNLHDGRHGGADEAPEMDGLAPPRRRQVDGHRLGRTDGGARGTLHEVGTVGHGIDGVVGQGPRIVGVAAEGDGDLQGFGEGGRGEGDVGDDALGELYVLIVGLRQSCAAIVDGVLQVVIHEEVEGRLQALLCGAQLQADVDDDLQGFAHADHCRETSPMLFLALCRLAASWTWCGGVNLLARDYAAHYFTNLTSLVTEDVFACFGHDV